MMGRYEDVQICRWANVQMMADAVNSSNTKRQL